MNRPNKILIFDFDSTLSNQNLFSLFGSNVHNIEQFYKNDATKRNFEITYFNEFDKMRALFSILVKKYNFRICIASFGYKHMIDRFIELSYGYDLIRKDDIIGTNGLTKNPNDRRRSSIDPNYAVSFPFCYNESGICKNHIITHFVQKYGTDDVIFFDDDRKNIAQAKHICKCVWINPLGSLTKDLVVDAINESIDNGRYRSSLA